MWTGPSFAAGMVELQVVGPWSQQLTTCCRTCLIVVSSEKAELSLTIGVGFASIVSHSWFRAVCIQESDSNNGLDQLDSTRLDCLRDECDRSGVNA